MSQIIYLDNNATTPIDPQVIDAMNEELSAPPHNPSSIHTLGQEAKKILAQSRKSIANFLKVKPSEIVFTSSGTEAMNLLIQGLLTNCKGHIIGCKNDHACVYQTLLDLEKKGAQVTFLNSPTPQALVDAISPNTKLIVLSAVNGETGTKIDLEKMGNIAQQAQIPLVIDGVALIGKEAVVIPKGVTGMGFSAHKFHGPPGIGFAFIRSKTEISPLIHGGNQEQKLRSGTENLPAIVGLCKALSLIDERTYSMLKRLRDLFERELKKLLPEIEVNGGYDRVSNVSNLYFPYVDNESLLISLDMNHIAASSASACASGALEPSRVLLSMGYSEKRARHSMRFSFSRMNTESEIKEAAVVIARVVTKLSSLNPTQ